MGQALKTFVCSVVDGGGRGGGDVLPASSLFHDLQLILLVVDVLGQVPVLSNTSDFGVVLELLLQLLAVVDGRLLSGRQLRRKREAGFRLVAWPP